MATKLGPDIERRIVSEEQDGDTVITTTRNGEGTLVSIVKRVNGKSHCTDGPAQILYRMDGTKEREIWFINGHRHRDDGPAETVYNSDGTMFRETWFRNGWIVLDTAHCIDMARRKR